MIRREYYMTRKDGVNLYRTYSDSGKMIMQLQTGYNPEAPISGVTSDYLNTEKALYQKHISEEL